MYVGRKHIVRAFAGAVLGAGLLAAVFLPDLHSGRCPPMSYCPFVEHVDARVPLRIAVAVAGLLVAAGILFAEDAWNKGNE